MEACYKLMVSFIKMYCQVSVFVESRYAYSLIKRIKSNLVIFATKQGLFNTGKSTTNMENMPLHSKIKTIEGGNILYRKISRTNFKESFVLFPTLKNILLINWNYIYIICMPDERKKGDKISQGQDTRRPMQALNSSVKLHSDRTRNWHKKHK